MNIEKGQHFFQSAVLFLCSNKKCRGEHCSARLVYLNCVAYQSCILVATDIWRNYTSFFAILQMVTFRNRVVVFLQSRNCAAPLQCLNYRRGDLWSPAYHLSLAYFISYVSVSSLPNNNHNRLRKSPVRSLSVYSFVSPYLYHSK